MNQAAPSPMPNQPKKSNTLLIVVVVLLVLCCLCLIIGAIGWQYGDQLLKMLGGTQ